MTGTPHDPHPATIVSEVEAQILAASGRRILAIDDPITVELCDESGASLGWHALDGGRVANLLPANAVGMIRQRSPRPLNRYEN